MHDVAPPLHAQTASSPAGFDALAAKAQADRETGNVEGAIRNYRAAVEVRPAWDEGWWYLGTLLYDSDHFDQAIPALLHVVDLQPKAGPAWAFLGLSEFETGAYSDAFSALRTARDIGFSEDPEVEKVALYHLALLQNLQSQFEDANELLSSAFGPNHFTEQIKAALGLALLRVPILPAQVDPSKDALIHAAGEAAILLADHEPDAASRNLEQMLRDFPDTPYLHYQYGVALAATGRYPQAEVQLREQIKTTPQSPAVYRALADVLKAQNKREEAAAASSRLPELKQQPDAAPVTRYALNHDTATAKSDGKNASADEPAGAGNFEAVARLAETERQAGHLEEAAAAYRNAVNLRRNWTEGWRQLGTIAYMRAQYPDAIAALQQAVALEGNQPDTWTLLGLSEFETRDYKNSLLHLERGRALGFSGNASAVRISRYHLALLCNRNGDFDRALDLLIPEIGAGALENEIQFAMGIALLRLPLLPDQVPADRVALIRQAGQAAGFLSESRYDKAFPILEKLLSEHPGTPFLHYAYGDALAATSMYDEAQIQLREEIRVNPESALPYLRLASVELQLHDSHGALENAKKAVSLTPESAEAHYLLGRSLLDEDQVPDAIHELETARRFSPNSPKVHFNLARAYTRAERAAEAEQERAEFERLNAMLPGQKKSYGDR